MNRRTWAWVAAAGALSWAPYAGASDALHTTYLWHLEQPIYWPAPNAGGGRYQTAWDSIQVRSAGGRHPENDVASIFSVADRVAAYQYRPRDSVQTMLGLPEAGAQMTYSGGLLENVASLAAAGQLGYGPGWQNAFLQARGWRTSGNQPRLDIVQFPFHHPILPLIDRAVAKMELALYRQAYGEAFGQSLSSGLFPSEMAFAEWTIPALVEAGVSWVVVSNAHLSRACADYPYVMGSGGDNMPPPNPAEAQNPPQGRYNRITIDRGVSPANAVPFSYVPHRARYVDPDTGVASTIIVVPSAQGESWKDGYACLSLDPFRALAPYNDPAHPMLVLMAHDGDNDFGGGYSYNMECTPTFVGQASQAGYTPSTVAQYLSDHPVPEGDVVHVEPGAWVNPDSDFGSPAFIKWKWPPTAPNGDVDVAQGASQDERAWAVITAATNVVLTASAAAGLPDAASVLHPDGGASDVAHAWHYLLGSLNSGYLYYGNSQDLLLKPIVASNEALRYGAAVLASRGAADDVAPTIWLPQRYPDNPGGVNYGPVYKYRKVVGSSDFAVWTYAYDVSGLTAVTLMVRADADGKNPLGDDANDTYAGGPGVGPWKAIAMTQGPSSKGPVTADDPSILPTAEAPRFVATVAGYKNTLLDYFVTATDGKGHIARSPIQHVYVGDPAAAARVTERR